MYVSVSVCTTDHRSLEKEVAELRVQLHAASVLSEAGDLRKALDRKEKERVQLSTQVEVGVYLNGVGGGGAGCFCRRKNKWGNTEGLSAASTSTQSGVISVCWAPLIRDRTLRRLHAT